MELETPRQLPKEENNSTKLRIRVAELMGWKRCPTGDRCWIHLATGFHRTPEDKGLINPIPAYDSDLDACHEFEQTLSPKEYDKYQSRVWNIAVMETPAGGDIQRACLSATAEHRSRAFIAVMEKQDSGEPGAV